MPQFSDSIEVIGDTDVFDVDLVAGRTYYFELEGSPTGAGTLPDGIVSLSRFGTLIASDDDGGVGLNSRLVFTATQTGIYQVQAAGFGVETGTYRLRAFEDDFRNSFEGTGASGLIATAGNRAGTLNYTGDADMFNTTLINGLTYTLEERGAATGDGSLSDPHLFLQDDGGFDLTNDDDGGTGLNSLITYTANYTGTHFLQARSFVDSGTDGYRIFVSEGRATAGNDIVDGTAVADGINGLAGNDIINGLGGNDILRGEFGNDIVIGGTGNDQVFGGRDFDTLRGQGGNDVLFGGSNADILIGGLNNDTFQFDPNNSTPAGRDVIRAGDGATAFQGAGVPGGDRIDLRGIDANENAGGDQGFILGGITRGRLSLVNSGTNTVVRGNTDGDAAFEFELLIEDGGVLASAYNNGDFFL